MATFKEARNDILTRVDTKWSEGGSPTENLKLLWGDVEEAGSDVPDGETPYGRADVRVISSRQAGFGDNVKRWRRTGILVIDVYTVSGDGKDLLDDILESLSSALEGHTTLPNGVAFLDFDSNDLGYFGHLKHTRVTANFDFDQVK